MKNSYITGASHKRMSNEMGEDTQVKGINKKKQHFSFDLIRVPKKTIFQKLKKRGPKPMGLRAVGGIQFLKDFFGTPFPHNCAADCGKYAKTLFFMFIVYAL